MTRKINTYLFMLVLVVLSLLNIKSLFAQTQAVQNTCAGGQIYVSSEPNSFNTNFIQIYILVSKTNSQILEINTTGIFSPTVAGTVYSMNYDPANASTLSQFLLVGQPINNLIPHNGLGCYAISPSVTFNIVACPPVSPSVVCTSNGSGVINVYSLPGSFEITHAQYYLLVNSIGKIIGVVNGAIDPSGTFSGVAPGNYSVYALNFDWANYAVISQLIQINDFISGLNGVSCASLSLPFNISVQNCCLANAGTVSIQTGNCPGDPLTVNLSNYYIDATNYSLNYIIVNSVTNVIVAMSGSLPANSSAGSYIFNPAPAPGVYKVYSLEYKNGLGVVPALAVGQVLNAVDNVSSKCYDYSNYAPTVTISQSLGSIAGTSNIYEGTTGGVSPFYYNQHELFIAGGSLPYNYIWDNSGYVRYEITPYTATLMVPGPPVEPGTLGVHILITYADNATWHLTVSDTNGCGGGSVVFSNDNIGGGNTNGPILDIDSYVITKQSGNTANGSITISPTGGNCTNYSYQWSGPYGYTANTKDIFNLVQGWYAVTVWCDANNNGIFDNTEHFTEGWYWVQKKQPGRGKMEQISTYVSVMPNPFGDESLIKFNISATTKTTIEIFSVDGKRIEELFNDVAKAQEEYTLPFKSGNLPNGVYLLKVTPENGEIVVNKLVINR